jgi:methylase of polypeptide subunit release factors
MVMFEIGYEQGRAAKEIFVSLSGYQEIRIEKDLAGHERFVRALCAAANLKTS